MKLNGSGIQDPALHELYLASTAEIDPARRAELISELFLEHARQAHYVYIVEAPDAVLTREDVNWPKGGRGRLPVGRHRLRRPAAQGLTRDVGNLTPWHRNLTP